MDLRFAAGELRSVHRFSNYRAERFENDADATQRRKDTGEAAKELDAEADGIEVLLTGVAALEAGKPGDAVAPLREATKRLPERVEPGYYLGVALYGTHDLAGAETKFRETVNQSPGLAAAHNQLGAVLFESGDKPGAVTEFQEALRLEPGNAKMRANLDQAMRTLKSENIAAEARMPPVAGEPTIRVDVRQVLVPVVVTDKDGHHVVGLAKTDFKVFEDGAEQKITAFSSERADVSAPASPNVGIQPTADGSPEALAKRPTYVICFDTTHGAFANAVHVREALQKLFRQEQAGNSEYVVLALGLAVETVQTPTSDPASVLATLGGNRFQKALQQGQKSSTQFGISLILKGNCKRCGRRATEVIQIAQPGNKCCFRKQTSSLNTRGSAPRNSWLNSVP